MMRPTPTLLYFAGTGVAAAAIVGLAVISSFDLPRPGDRDTDAPVEQVDDRVMVGVMEDMDVSRYQHPVRLVRVSEHLPVVTDMQLVPGHPGDLAVLQKGGVAVILSVDAGTFRPWFELEVNGASEMGLLGVAFAPDFEDSGVFYIHHSPPEGDRGVVSVFTCDPDTLEGVTRGADVLEVAQPFRNHDGGQLVFGPYGYLYVALGDGGSAYDPQGHGQNGQTWLGSILRVDPLVQGGFKVPADNPFVGNPDVDDAIFAYGLRNPWRFTFSPDGQLVTGDVGQNTFEEIDIVPAGGNLGWARAEGDACHEPPCEGFVRAVWTYSRQDGISVTGGQFPTSEGLPGLGGRYVFGDFGSGRLWAMELPDGAGELADEPWALGRFPIRPSTFGLDHQGRLYVADFEGAVHRVEALEP